MSLNYIKKLCLCLLIFTGGITSEILVRNCEPIQIELCRGIGYNETSMPNLVGHEIQSEADFTLQTFAPLIQYGCSAQLNFFLCSAYVPMCEPKVSLPIGPCRSLCETVRSRCHPVLQGFGFPWPTALECNRFPTENNHEHMCMEGPGEPGGGGGGGGNSGTGAGEGIINDSRDISDIDGNHYQYNNCHDLMKSHLYIRLNRSGKCVPLCDADILFTQHEKHIAEICITTWSISALIMAVLATGCFIVNDSKWDKVLLPLVTCHSLVSLGWTVRWLVGRQASSCGYDPQLPGTVLLLLADGLSNASCAVTFLLRYYFGMAGILWWAILCLKWHITVRRVRNETLNETTGDKKNVTFSSCTQLGAWGLPAIQTVGILVTRLLDADELIGACYVGNQSDNNLNLLVGVPIVIYWIFGAVNLVAGYLERRRKPPITKLHLALPHSTNISSPNMLAAAASPTNLNGLGTFLFIYSIPCIILLFGISYSHRDDLLVTPEPSMQPINSSKAPMWPFMLRFCNELLLGVLACCWALAPRMGNLWKNKLITSRYNKQKHPHQQHHQHHHQQQQQHHQQHHHQMLNQHLPHQQQLQQQQQQQQHYQLHQHHQHHQNHQQHQQLKYPRSVYSTTSYQTVCPQNSIGNIPAIHIRKYHPPPPPTSTSSYHVNRKSSRSYKTSNQSTNILAGSGGCNETTGV